MFSPPDYYPISMMVPVYEYEMATKIRDDAFKYLSTAQILNLRHKHVLERTPMDFLESIFWRSLRGNLFAAGPQGQIVRIDIMSILDMNDLVQFSVFDFARLRKDYDTQEMSERFQRKYKLIGDVKDIVDALNNNLAEPILRKAMQRAYWHYGYATVPFFFERRSYTINFDGFDFWNNALLENCFTETAEYQVEMLRSFTGWSLCLPTSFADGPWLEEVQRQKSGKGEVETSYTSQQTSDVKAIRSEKALADLIVSNFDAKQIGGKEEAKALLAQNFSTRGFLRAWDRAAEERPELSKPGRRSISGPQSQHRIDTKN